MYNNADDMQPNNYSTMPLVFDEKDSFTTLLCKDYDCILGVKSHERTTPQKILIELKIAFRQQQLSDDLATNIDKIISKKILNIRPFLLEHLALVLGDLIIENFPFFLRFELIIRKPQALPFADNAYVCLRMNR